MNKKLVNIVLNTASFVVVLFLALQLFQLMQTVDAQESGLITKNQVLQLIISFLMLGLLIFIRFEILIKQYKSVKLSLEQTQVSLKKDRSEASQNNWQEAQEQEALLKQMERERLFAQFADEVELFTKSLKHLEKTKNTQEQLLRAFSNAFQGVQGALYWQSGHTEYEIKATYARILHETDRRIFNEGEGFIGECIRDNALIKLTDVPAHYFKVQSGLGKVLPKHLLYLPLSYQNTIVGAIELATFQEVPPEADAYLKQAAEILISKAVELGLTARENTMQNELMNA
jgi:hypothetical protein